MKKYAKEWIILAAQLAMFYLFPLAGGPTDAMAVVLLILAATLVLSVLMGLLSNKRLKLLYPIAAAVLFVPSVWIYYNESALVHALWYLVTAAIGTGLGSLARRAFIRK